MTRTEDPISQPVLSIIKALREFPQDWTTDECYELLTLEGKTLRFVDCCTPCSQSREYACATLGFTAAEQKTLVDAYLSFREYINLQLTRLEDAGRQANRTTWNFMVEKYPVENICN